MSTTILDLLCRAYSRRAVSGEPCGHVAAWYARKWALETIRLEGHAGILARTVASIRGQRLLRGRL